MSSTQTVTVHHGMQSVEKYYSTRPTVTQIVGDANIKAVLGHTDNVRALVNNVELEGGSYVDYGTHVYLETRCNSKA